MANPEVEATFRFLHILAGITWIGLLYFFNLVNAPAIKFSMKKPVEVNMGAVAGRDIVLKTLWWFRWGAAMTVLFGLILMDQVAQRWGGWAEYTQLPQFSIIVVGAGLGLIMAFNVWFIIWPNQQVMQSNAVKMEAGAENADAMKAENQERAAKVKLASRFNFWASIPMLLLMVFAAHSPDTFGF